MNNYNNYFKIIGLWWLNPWMIYQKLLPRNHAKMSRNCMHLTEAEDINKRWQKYTEELYKKGLNDPDNHDGVVTHWELDILEYEVKWVLGSITLNKASGSDGISAELSKILKDDAVKVLHSVCQQIWKTRQWAQDWKILVFIPVPKKGSAKECSNCHTIVLISHASKVMLKILQARLQQSTAVFGRRGPITRNRPKILNYQAFGEVLSRTIFEETFLETGNFFLLSLHIMLGLGFSML